MRASILILTITFALAFCATFDFDQATDDNAEYCEMVGAGAWPDYDNNYDEMCL